MELSIFLAKAWGLYMIIACLAFLINKRNVKGLLESIDNGSLYIGGAISLILGVLNVLVHNIWSGPAFVVIVTIFGWIALIKGFVLLASPSHTRKVYQSILDGSTTIMLVIGVLVGAYLAYSGFVA
jgi:hypothetical protein